jgi:hypothetical protein
MAEETMSVRMLKRPIDGNPKGIASPILRYLTVRNLPAIACALSVLVPWW